MVSLVWGDIKVEWWNADEGVSGEYDAEDPNDVNYLRFDVLRFGEVSFVDEDKTDNVSLDWVNIDDASYCTLVPADTDEFILSLLALYIMNKVYMDASSSFSIKKECERLSWIKPEWIIGWDEL